MLATSVSTYKRALVSSTYNYQGLHHFRTFREYYDKWVIPNLLPDLHTIFEGAIERWQRDGRPTNGRGDFLLATALFSIFDHVGAFLAKQEDHSLETQENIARVALSIPSYEDICCVISKHGRNSLVHGAWPQTTMVIRPANTAWWGFGLNITATPDLDEHDLIFVRQDEIPTHSGGTMRLRVVQLLLNVRTMRLDFDKWLRSSFDPNSVDQRVFHRLRDLSVGNDPLRRKRDGNAVHISDKLFRDQINAIRAEASRMNLWNKAAGLDLRMRRGDPKMIPRPKKKAGPMLDRK